MLSQPSILVLLGVYDCINAKAKQVSFGIAGLTLGVPNYRLLSASKTLYTISKMGYAISIVLIADLDTGYNNPLNVIRTAQDALKQGILGIILKNQVFLKKCSYFEGKQVINTTEHIEKIKAARYASGNGNLIIVARVEKYQQLEKQFSQNKQ